MKKGNFKVMTAIMIAIMLCWVGVLIWAVIKGVLWLVTK